MRNFLLILPLFLFISEFTQAQLDLIKSGKKQSTSILAENFKAELQKHCPLNIKTTDGEDFTLNANGQSSGPSASQGSWTVDANQLVIQNKTEGKEFRFSIEMKNKSLHIDDHEIKKDRKKWSVDFQN